MGWRPHRPDADFDQEIQAHLAAETDRLVEDGLSRAEAEVAARRVFGNVTNVRERFYESRRALWLEDAWRNLRYSVRMLRRTPGFAAVAVLTLALGIGANTTLFSVLYGVLLKALPYPEADRIVTLEQNVPSSGYDGLGLSKPQLLRLRDTRDVFSAIGGYGFQDVVLTTSTNVEKLTAARVTVGVAELLGARLQLGRGFRSADEQPGSESVAIVSHRLWQRVFGSDPRAVGLAVRLDDHPTTIVGVMSADFVLPDDLTGTVPSDLYVPVRFNLSQLNWGSYTLTPVARLAPGVSVTVAAAAVRTTFEQLQMAHPEGSLGGPGYTVQVTPLRQEVVRAVAPALWMLTIAVGLVLLIGCANIANLLLARNSSRHAEFALRTALGASNGHLMRQLLTESSALAVLGAALGVGLAELGIRAIRGLIIDSVPRAAQVKVDLPVLVFTAVIGGLVALLVGILPAWRIRRGGLTGTIRPDARGVSTGTHQRRVQGLLVVSEVALAMLLVVCSGLVLRSFYRLIKVDPGFAVDHLLTMQVNLPTGRYHDPALAKAFYNDAVSRIRALPGVVSASAITGFPLADWAPDGTFEVDRSLQSAPGSQSGHFFFWAVTPGYFETLKLSVTRGRSFSPTDGGSAPPVVIVSERLSDRYWPGENPIGRHLRMTSDSGPPGRWTEVVGVVRNVPLRGLDEEPQPEAYYPLLPRTGDDSGVPDRATLAIRTTGEPSTEVGPVRSALSGLDRAVPVSNILSADDLLSGTAAGPRLNMILLSVFGGLAIGLAAIGVYGLTAYAVRQRAREIAIRAALGGRPLALLRLLLGEGLTLIAIGLTAGLGCALLVTKLMTRLLFEITPSDPATFGLAAAALLAGSCAAVCLPAWRALRVDIAPALRSVE